MLPHVFARFQKICVDAIFDTEHTEGVELWIDEIDGKYIVRQEDADVFMATLRSSSFMKDLVQLLSNSPLIAKLEFCLDVEVMANSNLMMMDDEDDDEDEDSYLEKEDKIDRVMDVANERATELFLDSGVCEPLLALENVQTFDLVFGIRQDDEEKYTKLPRHVKLMEGMKTSIEANFKAELADRKSSKSPLKSYWSKWISLWD